MPPRIPHINLPPLPARDAQNFLEGRTSFEKDSAPTPEVRHRKRVLALVYHATHPGSTYAKYVSIHPTEGAVSTSAITERTSPADSKDETPESAHRRKPTPLKWKILQLLPPIMLLLGIIVLLYPVIATQHNNARQQEIADQYTAEMTNVGPDVLAAELQAADHYNATLAESPILDPWLESQRPDTPQYQNYLSQLDINPVMGQVVIPKIHVDLPIYHGTTDDVLNKGIGHLFGTALPVGGTSTHSVITGHTGLGTATMFDNLTKIENGDVFYLQVAGRYLKYEVNDIRIVLPNETDTLNKVIGRDLATLITCTPYGVNSHRLLVTGERVPIDPEQARAETAAATPAPMQTWMIWVLIAVGVISLIAVGLFIRWLLIGRRRKRDEKKADEARIAALAAAARDGYELPIDEGEGENLDHGTATQRKPKH